MLLPLQFYPSLLRQRWPWRWRRHSLPRKQIFSCRSTQASEHATFWKSFRERRGVMRLLGTSLERPQRGEKEEREKEASFSCGTKRCFFGGKGQFTSSLSLPTCQMGSSLHPAGDPHAGEEAAKHETTCATHATSFFAAKTGLQGVCRGFI